MQICILAHTVLLLLDYIANFHNIFSLSLHSLSAAAPSLQHHLASMSSVNEKLGGVVTMKYLALGKIGGRAGPLRFLMLAHGVDFEETLFPMSEWPAKKAAMIKSGVL